MSKRDHLQSLARKVTGNNNLHCGTVKDALHCIAEKAAGESIKCNSICSALDTIEKNYENLIGGEPLKYHLYAWDYAGGAAIAYSEKEVPQAGDVVFLKEDMEGGKITDTNQLKLVYHVVSDAEGVITVSEHPEGETGGYVFNRNAEDDYEETVTDVRDLVDITQNGFLMSQKGTMFKGANVNVSSEPTKLYGWYNSEGARMGENFYAKVIYTLSENPKSGDHIYFCSYGEGESMGRLAFDTLNEGAISENTITFLTLVFTRDTTYDYPYI